MRSIIRCRFVFFADICALPLYHLLTAFLSFAFCHLRSVICVLPLFDICVLPLYHLRSVICGLTFAFCHLLTASSRFACCLFIICVLSFAYCLLIICLLPLYHLRAASLSFAYCHFNICVLTFACCLFISFAYYLFISFAFCHLRSAQIYAAPICGPYHTSVDWHCQFAELFLGVCHLRSVICVLPLYHLRSVICVLSFAERYIKNISVICVLSFALCTEICRPDLRSLPELGRPELQQRCGTFLTVTRREKGNQLQGTYH